MCPLQTHPHARPPLGTFRQPHIHYSGCISSFYVCNIDIQRGDRDNGPPAAYCALMRADSPSVVMPLLFCVSAKAAFHASNLINPLRFCLCCLHTDPPGPPLVRSFLPALMWVHRQMPAVPMTVVGDRALVARLFVRSFGPRVPSSRMASPTIRYVRPPWGRVVSMMRLIVMVEARAAGDYLCER
jgi:hypothetical protein